VDFYNQAAIHNDTRGPAHGGRNAATRPDRDHHFGRIWRLQHKEAKKLPPVERTIKPPDLVKLLEHPNGWVRGTAQRLLNEGAGAEVVPALKTMVKSGATSYARINALWTLNNLGKLDNSLVLVALDDKDALLRKNAFLIAGEANNDNEIAKRLLGGLNDSDPRAKLNAIIALGSLEPSQEIARAVVAAWPDLKDKYLESAALGVAAKGPAALRGGGVQRQRPAVSGAFCFARRAYARQSSGCGPGDESDCNNGKTAQQHRWPQTNGTGKSRREFKTGRRSRVVSRSSSRVQIVARLAAGRASRCSASAHCALGYKWFFGSRSENNDRPARRTTPGHESFRRNARTSRCQSAWRTQNGSDGHFSGGQPSGWQQFTRTTKTCR
jgi:hypothetical protein